MPRTVWRISASGWSEVALPGVPDLSLAQSVRDRAEEELRFATGRLAERDDADFIGGLRMDD